ncbi:MAG TPA: BatA and WFA domain-containing protein [Gemmataceae bacterium]|nr:BatA and WFA domain-containing protein [Gemmataceae bacterium]
MASRPPDFLHGLARSWFALAMLLLVLIAIPGFLLFALNLFGGEGSVNNWLQGRFQLTYHIPLAWWIALILLLVPVAIVLLYFLKLKRKPLSVPSTFLWRKSIEDLHVNALFQWLRQNLLLLLQLLALLVLIYAMMDFRVHGRTGEGKHYILMIDNSASMGSTDVAPSRLHWAKEEALKEVDAATDQDFGMVIVFNSSAEILQSYTNNRGQLRSAIDKIEQTQRPTRIEEALSLADSLANPTRSADDAGVRPANVEPGKERTYVAAEGMTTEVHLFSDGRFPDLPEFALGNLNISFHVAGIVEREEPSAEMLKTTGLATNPRIDAGPVRVNNVALVAFNALRDDTDPSKLQVFARVLNFRNSRVNTKVRLDVMVNGAVKGVYARDLELEPRGVKIEKVTSAESLASPEKAGKAPERESFILQTVPSEASVTFELPDIDDRSNTVLHAKLEGISDHFPLDDEAWLVVGVVRKARVLVVGNNNDVLNAFFDDDATRQVATLSRLTPDSLTKDAYRKPARNGDFDFVVFDRCGPQSEDDMPRGNTFFIGYPPPPWKRAELETIANPQIKGWMGKHPIMRYLTALQEVGIAEAFKMKNLPPRTPRLLEIDQNNILLLTLSRQSFTDLVMTFPILNDKGDWNTNWPLLPSFPLFLRNVLYGLGNISDGAGEDTVQPGQVKTLHPDQAVTQLEVIDPAGNKQALDRGTRVDFSYGQTNQVGVYRVSWGGNWQRSFAVNLLDADESNIEPRTSIQIGAETIAGGRDRDQPRELWKWLVLLALGLLLTEWYIYNRRVYV